MAEGSGEELKGRLAKLERGSEGLLALVEDSMIWYDCVLGRVACGVWRVVFEWRVWILDWWARLVVYGDDYY